MDVLRENLKKLPPKHRVGFALSGAVVLLLVSLDISSWFMPDVNATDLVAIIVNCLDVLPNIGRSATDNFVN